MEIKDIPLSCDPAFHHTFSIKNGCELVHSVRIAGCCDATISGGNLLRDKGYRYIGKYGVWVKKYSIGNLMGYLGLREYLLETIK